MESCGEQAAATSSSQAQEALFAEAARLLKGVSLKPVRVGGDLAMPAASEAPEVDQGWLRSAVSHASDPGFALVGSGATNALRQAKEG